MAKGAKTGGRAKGTPNKRTVEVIAAVEASGLTPLDYMLSILRDDSNEVNVRFEAAKAAAPYVHARLAAIEVGNKDNKAFEIVGKLQRDAAVKAALRANT